MDFFAQTLLEEEVQLDAQNHLLLALRCFNECPNLPDNPHLKQYLAANLQTVEKLLGDATPYFYKQTQMLKFLYTTYSALIQKSSFKTICITNPELAQWLGSRDPSLVKMRDADGLFPVHLVAQAGDLEVTQWFDDRDPSIMKGYAPRAWLALHKAAERGDLEMAQWLRDRNLSLVTKFDAKKLTPLHIAARQGNLEMCKLCAYNTTWIIRKPLHSRAFYCAAMLLHYLSSNVAKIALVAMFPWSKKYSLLNSPFGPLCENVSKHDDLSPSTTSVVQHSWSLFRLLNGGTPIFYFLNSELPPLNWRHIPFPLNYSQLFPHLFTLLQLMDSVKLFGIFGAFKIFCFLTAVRTTCAIEEPTLRHNFRTNYYNHNTTPLHLAANHGHLEVVQWFHAQEPAAITQYDEDGQTAWDLAMKNRHFQVAKWIGNTYPQLKKNTRAT
jgi:hypothetical protein